MSILNSRARFNVASYSISIEPGLTNEIKSRTGIVGVGVGVLVEVGVGPGGVGVGVGVGVAVGVPKHKTTPFINSFLVTET